MAHPSSRTPTRVELDRLTARCERLQADVEVLRQKVQSQGRELQTQFIRIAEMQAVLDEEQIAAGRPRTARPLLNADP